MEGQKGHVSTIILNALGDGGVSFLESAARSFLDEKSRQRKVREVKVKVEQAEGKNFVFAIEIDLKSTSHEDVQKLADMVKAQITGMAPTLIESVKKQTGAEGITFVGVRTELRPGS